MDKAGGLVEFLIHDLSQRDGDAKSRGNELHRLCYKKMK